MQGRTLTSLTIQNASNANTGIAVVAAVLPSTSPISADSDDDGIEDQVEIDLLGTSPLDRDTDHDGLDDLFEISNGFDPLDGGSTNPDQSAAGDPDGDGLDNRAEQALGTDPNTADTDADGLFDGAEVAAIPLTYNFNGMANAVEIQTESEYRALSDRGVRLDTG